MRHALAGVVLAAIAATRGINIHAQEGSGAVRPENPGIRALIATGMKRSATFRDLNSRLDRSDVIVYVRSSRCPGRVGACLAWASAGGGVRRLLVTLDAFGRSPDELTALLAHELQHANEVAATLDITDLASFQRSFEFRGWKHGSGFETGEAIDITRTVAGELARPLRARDDDAAVRERDGFSGGRVP